MIFKAAPTPAALKKGNEVLYFIKKAAERRIGAAFSAAADHYFDCERIDFELILG